MGAIATDRLISVAFGALLAWAAHSSVAVALLVMSFTEKGVIPLDAALALIIGTTSETALNPLIEGARGGDAAGRRVVGGNVVTRLVGAAIALPLLTPIGIGLVQIEPNFSRAVADFHTAFNVVLALAFLPLLEPLARVLERPMPQRLAAADPARPLYLDDSALETPSMTWLRGARGAEDGRCPQFDDPRRRRILALRPRRRAGAKSDDVLDALNGEIKRYLTRLDPESLTDEEHAASKPCLLFGEY